MTEKHVSSAEIAKAITKAPVYSNCIGRIGQVTRVDDRGWVHVHCAGHRPADGVTTFDRGDEVEMIFENGRYILRNPELSA